MQVLFSYFLNPFVVGLGSKNQHHIRHLFRRDWTTSLGYIKTPYPIKNIIGRTYIFSSGINKHALPIMLTKFEKVQFSIRFLLMLHRTFASAT